MLPKETGVLESSPTKCPPATENEPKGDDELRKSGQKLAMKKPSQKKGSSQKLFLNFFPQKVFKKHPQFSSKK